MIEKGPIKNIIPSILPPVLFNPLSRLFDPFGKLSEFFFYARVIIAVILVLYVHKVLNTGSKVTVIIGAIIFLVFFTDFWIFGSMQIIALTIIAVLLLKFLD